MAEIPTMACEECIGTGRVDDLPDAYYPCPECRESGRIPRPPLTAEEIAALPDGALVVEVANHVDYPAWRGRVSLGSRRGGDVEIPQPDGTTVCFAVGECRVWLADPPPLCTICREHHGREVEHACE